MSGKLEECSRCGECRGYEVIEICGPVVLVHCRRTGRDATIGLARHMELQAEPSCETP